jgi:hypothetical protein
MAQGLDRRGESDAGGLAAAVMNELRDAMLWYDALDPILKFLSALPSIVAAAGLLSHWVRTRLANRLGNVERP